MVPSEFKDRNDGTAGPNKFSTSVVMSPAFVNAKMLFPFLIRAAFSAAFSIALSTTLLVATTAAIL
jgi:hypothetical protein